MAKTLPGWFRLMGTYLPRVTDAVAVEAAKEAWCADADDDYCGRCGATIAPQAVVQGRCPFCVGRDIRWGQVVRLGAYEPPLATWIMAMKFGGQWAWADWLGQELAKVLPGADGDDRTVVCPTPMHWLRRWHRGFNQAELMAVAIARARRWRMVNLLRRVRYTPPQTAIPPSQRHVNVRGSVSCLPVDLRGWRVWLVDDVKTSGATLNTCALVLRRAGAAEVNVAVAAVADPRGQGFRHQDVATSRGASPA